MDRKKEIIHLLLEAKKPMTTTEISTQFNVSSRTIRSDLTEIEAEISSHDLQLVKKPRVGISIQGSSKQKDKLYLDLQDNHGAFEEIYSKESRRKYILTKLLLGKNRMYTEYFAQTFYTSKSTIEKDLIFLSEWLNQHNLKLERKSNQGLYVTGRESDIRNAFAIVISSMEDENDGTELMLKEQLDFDIKKIQKSIQKWADEYNLELSDANIKNLAFHITIMFSRISQNKILKETNVMVQQIDILKKRKDIQALIKLLQQINKSKVPEGEVNYILLHLIGMTMDNNVILHDDTVLMELRETAEEITDEFMENIEHIVCLGLPNNLSLRESLVIHLLPTIYRLKYGLNLYNPLLNEIKEKYASAFALSSIINASFKRKLGLVAGEEEIAFIALHVSLALEKAKEKITIAVVCPMGRGISRFLLLKLEENFPQINFLNYSLKDISGKAIPYVDLVVSTVPIEIEKPSITISAILSDEDIKIIKTMIRNFENKDKKYFSLQSVIVQHERIGKKAVLKVLSDRLLVCNYVDDTFFQGVLEREKMGSTEIGNGIVLTHGFHESVRKSQIAFCKLQHPVLWNTQLVEFIVMMAIEKNDAKNVMQMDWLYKTLNNDKAIQKIKESTCEKEIFKILEEEYAKY